MRPGEALSPAWMTKSHWPCRSGGVAQVAGVAGAGQVVAGAGWASAGVTKSAATAAIAVMSFTTKFSSSDAAPRRR